ncbi:MAG: hypothetical protein IIC73_01435 [Armatimonadetes bacterium]|nr:hypothetical protein [Armatimonadota bacterium]
MRAITRKNATIMAMNLIGPRKMLRTATLASWARARARIGVLFLEHSGHLGPAAPMMAHDVQIARPHLPQRSLVVSRLCR